jgi:hypothetical protein
MSELSAAKCHCQAAGFLLHTLLNSAEYTITTERILLFPCPKLDTATGGLNEAITSLAVVYSPAERAEKLFLFLLYPCLLCGCIRGDRKKPTPGFAKWKQNLQDPPPPCVPLGESS